jgi:anti-sigma factor RsiW
MKTRTNAFPGTHPSLDQLDRMRCGLLDDDPDTRAVVAAHLETCPECKRQEALWPRVSQTLDHAAADRGIANALATRRRRALRGLSSRTPVTPHLRFAVAAALGAVAIGIGAVLMDMNKSPAPTSTVPTSTLAASDAPTPDLYADLDFYLWLMHKQAHADGSPNG